MSQYPKILTAFWISKDQIFVFLTNDWLFKDALPPLYFNQLKLSHQNLKLAPLKLFGKFTGYCKENDTITFIHYPNSEEENKRIYIAGNFNGWGKAIGNDKWLLKLTTTNNEKIMSVTLPWKDIVSFHSEILFKFVTEKGEWLPIPIETPNLSIDNDNNNNYQLDLNRTGQNAFIITTDVSYDPSLTYEISWIDPHLTEINRIDDRILLATLGSTQELGSIVNSSGTTFRIFAPKAKSVRVFFYKDLQSKKIFQLDLQRNDDYTWEANWPESLHGYYYYYNVSKDQLTDTPILDPYAVACFGPAGPGLVIDKQFIPKIKSNFTVPQWNDLIILEAHLRDLLYHTSFVDKVEKPIGFRNLIKWLESKDNYIKNLRINAIELMPIQEYECGSPLEYHWGYMPTNYFCPASSYVLGENELSQIIDFQKLVNTFHENGISVILDVVYNHSGNPNHLANIDKDYYFELTSDGTFMDWCGCGNDFKANTPMGKRLIIDSLIYLIKTFDVDGFRFDLAELLGIDVLKEIESAVKKVKPSIILIAEPWSFRGHIGYALKPTGFASWNDGYREFVVNYVRGRSNQDAFAYFVTGSIDYLARFTTQSVNYAASHDDYCWIDRITENANHNGSDPTAHDIRRTHLMVSILMMSIGIPMLAEGQDFLHSKQGHSNTYQNEHLNALNYLNLANYSNTHQYFKRWIQFRLSVQGQAIRLNEIPSKKYFKFYKHPESSMIGILYNADLSLNKISQLFFVVNPDLKQHELSLSDLTKEDFLQVADQERFNLQGLEGGLIPWNNEKLIIPGLSCGLWIKIAFEHVVSQIDNISD